MNAPAVVHKTRTFRLSYERFLNWKTERLQEDPWSKAVCSCGWSAYGDDRVQARRKARAHREEAGSGGSLGAG